MIDKVSTIFIVMMENRSFDHLLGHLSLEGLPVEGVRQDEAWRDQVANHYGVHHFKPHLLDDPYSAIEADPPHGRATIADQLGDFADGKFRMDGFVRTYAELEGLSPIDAASLLPVMGYFAGEHAPVTDFLARNFAICDHWYCSLPAGTQPNRLMAMSGYTRIDENKVPIPSHDLVYDWLTARGIRWRVYHESIPFFALMPDRVDDILLGKNFRPFAHFYNDVQNEPPDEFPQVVFLEPTYSDAPHIGRSSDDHAPAGIRGGQEFLLEVYRGLSRVPDLWNGSVMILTYDEHGGFFDHVSPPRIQTKPPEDALFTEAFESLGVRVPAIVVSPLVKAGTVCHEVMDHTSVLKFIGDVFGGGSYSPSVDTRPVASVSKLLNNEAGRKAPVVPSLNAYLAKAPDYGGRVPGTKPESPIQAGFQDALERIDRHSKGAPALFSDLIQNFVPQSKRRRK